MSDSIAIHLRDLGGPLVEAWREAFAGIESVRVSCGDIFSDRPGPIEPGAPIDVKADVIVSPANSFGFMDGGIDAVYTYQFGAGLQERLQAVIRDEHGGELPVGQAAIVETGHDDIPWCVSAPTMRIPRDVSDTVNAYLAFRAALRAVLAHNASGEQRIESLLCPGLGTAVGRMPVHRCARQMRMAWDRVLGGAHIFPGSLGVAADDEYEMLA
jgi:O-acetyl-ADP-ribose deacetylase (regulator of RNase III)